MDRIKKLCRYLDGCDSFADVGCDHGYCTLYMLKSGKCKTAVVSDVSEKCLNKAVSLLGEYISAGKARAVVCDGLEKIPRDISEVLIAGMGGEEIISILKNSFVPESFVLQPMKNARLVRAFLASRGAEISADEYFESGGKFYCVIKGRAEGKETAYSEAELEFGKNFAADGTREFIKSVISKNRAYLSGEMSEKSRAEIQGRIDFAEGVLNGEIR